MTECRHKNMSYDARDPNTLYCQDCGVYFKPRETWLKASMYHPITTGVDVIRLIDAASVEPFKPNGVNTTDKAEEASKDFPLPDLWR